MPAGPAGGPVLPRDAGPGRLSPGRRRLGQAQEVIGARTGVTVGRAQLTGLAEDLAAWTEDFYAERARDADTDLPATDVIMIQATARASPCAGAPQERRED